MKPIHDTNWSRRPSFFEIIRAPGFLKELCFSLVLFSFIVVIYVAHAWLSPSPGPTIEFTHPGDTPRNR